MILYHTSDREIRNPDIHHGRKNADFGWGFYLTPDKEFTYRWARDNAVVNVYELNTVNDSLTADVVIGPIANDTIFDTFGIISSGYLEPEKALKLLMIGPAYTQIAIKTQKAVQQLKWTRSERITRTDEAILKAEQDAFQEVFAAELNMILDEGENRACSEK